jgi:hypothetical protein
MSDLLIPYALTGPDRDIVFPDRAFPGGDYLCPECLGKVGLKVPTQKRTHFFHYAPSVQCALNPSQGGGEGLEHAQAKHMLYVWLLGWLSDEIETEPKAVGHCATHQKIFSITIPKPNPFSLHKEFALPSGRRLDVALLNVDGQVSMGFEINSTNAVTADKAKDLPARWLELRADSVIEAFDALRSGKPVPSLKMLRWAEYDVPSCCKRRAATRAIRSSVRALETSYLRESVETPEYVRKPIKRDASDSVLLSAAGKACSDGQTPKGFAAAHAAATGASETAILHRLLDYGIAKSTWRWS